jgi:hypothetical protein
MDKSLLAYFGQLSVLVFANKKATEGEHKMTNDDVCGQAHGVRYCHTMSGQGKSYPRENIDRNLNVQNKSWKD